MHARWGRIAAASALTVAMAGAGIAATASMSDASTPIIVGSCATSVQGTPGTPVELQPSAVLQPIVNLIDAIPVLGPPLAAPFASTFNALPPIPLGALPDGKGYITGGQIANAVVAQLDRIPLLGPILGTLTSGVESTLTSLCGIGMNGANAVVAPVQDGTGALATASGQLSQGLGVGKSQGAPGSGGGPGSASGPGPGSGPAGGSGAGQGMPQSNSPVLGGLPWADELNGSAFGPAQLLAYDLAESPLARYSGIPFASAGLFAPAPGVRYGGDVPGYDPGFGILGQDDNPRSDGVRTAGHAEALNPGGGLPGGIGLPMLLAVLALSGVTAALVRTWVLRRVRIG